MKDLDDETRREVERQMKIIVMAPGERMVKTNSLLRFSRWVMFDLRASFVRWGPLAYLFGALLQAVFIIPGVFALLIGGFYAEFLESYEEARAEYQSELSNKEEIKP